MARFRRFAGTRRVHFRPGGHLRARATSRDLAWDVLETVDRDDWLGKFLQTAPVRKLWPAPGGAADNGPNLRTGVLAIALFD